MRDSTRLFSMPSHSSFNQFNHIKSPVTVIWVHDAVTVSCKRKCECNEVQHAYCHPTMQMHGASCMQGCMWHMAVEHSISTCDSRPVPARPYYPLTKNTEHDAHQHLQCKMLAGLEMNRTRGTVIAYDRHINKTTHTCSPVSSYVQGICTPACFCTHR